MKLSKGQWTIGEIFLFSLTIVFTLVIFMMLASTDSIVEEETKISLDFALDEVKKRSVIAVTMGDYMWRAPSRTDLHGKGPLFYRGVGKEEYGNLPAYKVISYYFTTSGDHIYVHGEKKSRKDVRKDVKSYLHYKMDTHWGSGPGETDYYYNLTANHVNGAPQGILVKSKRFSPSGEWSGVKYPIALDSGHEAIAILWTKTSGSIYGTTGD